MNEGCHSRMNIHIDIIMTALCMGILMTSSGAGHKLPPPIISLDPSLSVYNMGDSITILCSPPKPLKVKMIQFYKEGYIPPLKEAEDNTYVIPISNKGNGGRYSCTYSTEIQEKLMTSLSSEHVIVNVSDKLPPPIISLDPSLSVYNMGDSITILCSPPKLLKVKMIQFYKEGYIPPLKEAEDNTYVITISNKENGGRYSCAYSTEIQERLMTSLSSEHVIVNVSAFIERTTEATTVHETSTLDMRSKTSISTGQTTTATMLQQTSVRDNEVKRTS
ncbi:platelet glycoprotein VI-like [Anomaloglossus baeobatrachus]|uniref:platelet glycoprotein VI-like n=1 Tax=Anomaloglossus baeobatrachus TaxID=238106 RepID=UPI003F4F77CF